MAEELALVLSTHGMQRMTARVLAALVFTEQPTMTMGELAEQLQAS
ncbi:MAG: MarR family transcriptional regulator, partial [Actinomycetota bacterium]|nr:MarR family transcriptional regulator [Actinomycetota bacterium]